jgi:hypothetical protein
LIRYRFKRNDIGFIAGIIPWENGLDVHGKMRTSRRRYYIDQLEATSIMLRRLATPCRWVDLHEEFGKHSSALTEIFYHALELFYSKFSPLVHVWPENIVRERAAYYAKCVTERGAVLPHVVGFIDGTSLEIARPKGNAQRATYSGHKRRNCIKFQAISAPDGCILHLFGPMEGRRHDMTLYRESSIDQALQASLLVDGVQYYIYGDPAYCLRPYLQVGFQGSDRTPENVLFNASMARVRIAVEWAFRDVKLYFTHLTVPRKLRLRVTPAGLWYTCSVLLWNFRACLYGSQAAKYFDCDPLSLHEYLEALH